MSIMEAAPSTIILPLKPTIKDHQLIPP